MPVALRSRPSEARVRASESAIKDDEKATDDSLSVVARDSRDVVKAAWASDAESKRGVVVGGDGLWTVAGKGCKRLRSKGSGKCLGEDEDGEEAWGSMILLEESSRILLEEDASDSSCRSSSWRRSVRVLSRARWLKSLVCAACLRDWILMEDDSCSRRSSRLRAYSRFYCAMVRGKDRIKDD